MPNFLATSDLISLLKFQSLASFFTLTPCEVILHLPNRNVENILISSCVVCYRSDVASVFLKSAATPFSEILIIQLSKLNCISSMFNIIG